jgi:hypothetical protein
MKETTPGSPDGIHVNTYRMGETYDIPAALAKAFVIDMKVADAVDAPPVDHAVPLTVPAQKMQKAAYENKAVVASAEVVAAVEEPVETVAVVEEPFAAKKGRRA